MVIRAAQPALQRQEERGLPRQAVRPLQRQEERGLPHQAVRPLQRQENGLFRVNQNFLFTMV